jgi:hypothetical protein
MVEFFKTVGIGASFIPFAIAVVAMAAGLTALWAPSAKRQSRAVQVLKIVLRIPASRPPDRPLPVSHRAHTFGAAPPWWRKWPRRELPMESGARRLRFPDVMFCVLPMVRLIASL